MNTPVQRNPSNRSQAQSDTEFRGQEDVKKLIWLIFRDFNFDPECIPILRRSFIEHPGKIFLGA